MEYFQLRPDSVAILAEFMLSAVLLLYLLSLKNKSKDAWLFTGIISLLMLYYATDFTHGAFIRASWTRYVWLLHDWTLGGFLIFVVWFSYAYRHNPYRRETFASLVVTTGLISYTLLTQWRPAIWAIVPLPILITAWCVSVHVRKFIRVSRLVNHPPEHQDRKAFLAFIPLKILGCFGFINAFLAYNGYHPLSNLWGVFHHTILLIYTTWWFINYINFAQERTTFQAKLVGLFLCVVLLVLGISGVLIDIVPHQDSPGTLTNYFLNLLAWAELIMTGLILFLFPVFFRNTLLRPLNAVLSGVQQVNSGNLTTIVPVTVRDEIGYLGQSFNQMTESLHRYAQQMETLVAERTAQLQHSLNTLQATQTQLIQKEKMASLGELTAGIAHEIQNPLNFVNNFAEVSAELAEELEKSAENADMEAIRDLSAGLKENMGYIVENGQRAASIVRSMLEHSRTSSDERRPTDLNELADEYLRLAYHGMRRSEGRTPGDPAQESDFQVELITDFDPDLPLFEVAPQEIGRVLLNLYSNAFYAVREKQYQQIAVGGVADEGPYQPTVWVSTRQVEGQVELSVKDNGMGIPDGIRDKIFQPFFTTKPTGQGTGLGLSLSYDIITKGHGGEMWVRIQEGEGTDFVIALPLIASEASGHQVGTTFNAEQR